MTSAPACKADVPYNFGQASGLDSIVYGAARPGAKGQRCFNPDDKVTEAEVQEWATFVRGAGVERVVGLLTDSELQTYITPPVEVLSKEGLHATNVNLEGVPPHEAMKKIEQELSAAEEAGQKVVVHCWGGGGRTGKVLAAWAASRHGLSPSDAAAAVESYAKQLGSSRRVDVKAVHGLLGDNVE